MPSSSRPPSSFRGAATSTVSHENSVGRESRNSRRTALATSPLFLLTSILALIGWILLVVSFSAPYWLSSWAVSYSSFIRMGLWDFCFHDYRHRTYQYDQKFDGCHWIYSSVYQSIRHLFQPGWLILVQAMMTIAFVISSISLVSISLTLMYYFVKYQIITILVSAVLQLLTAIPILIAVAVFGGMAFDGGWIQHPQFNHLDWAYFTALGAFLFHSITAGLLILETFRVRERKKKLNNLIYNMQPRF